MVYDFHSHVLFGIDDGARDIETAKEMLLASKAAGVDTILLTPHCFPLNSNDVDKFVHKRAAAYNELMKIPDIPKLHKGCEVHLTCDLSQIRNIRKLCIKNTHYMLLEMPYSKWSEKTIEWVYNLTLTGVIPIIAHDERNKRQDLGLRNALFDLDVLIQLNASSFYTHKFKKEAFNLLRHGLGHVIGTDMHNMTTRRPCLDKAEKKIKQQLGTECWDYFMGNAEKILNDEEISYREFRSFKKKKRL